MKTVRIIGGTVAEVIPSYALPVEEWYGGAFADQCVEAPDEVEQRWVYDRETKAFSPPPDPEATPEPGASDSEVLAALLGV